MTGQTILNYMEILNPELQLQSGEADAARGLTALVMAQTYMETILATQPGSFGGTLAAATTAANTETSTLNVSDGLVRIDRIQMLDAAGKPIYDLDRINRAGGHTGRSPSIYDALSTTSGRPTAYWTNGLTIYWYPVPDSIYSVRIYGYVRHPYIEAGSAIDWPDFVALPLATMAVKLLKLGLDDPIQDISGLAQETFKPILDMLENYTRDGAKGLQYTQVHSE